MSNPLKMTHLIDGKAIAHHIQTQLAQRVNTLKQKGIEPCLAVILVGDNPASRVYVNHKIKACAHTGIASREIILPVDTTLPNLLATIDSCNQDSRIHGLLVQLPLPKGLDANAVIERIALSKDVDGFHLQNHGALVTNTAGLRPCTPLGVMKMLAHECVDLRGAHAVVVGASNIVGKPMAMLLQNAGATVTICNSKTRDLSLHTRLADVLVVAVGKPRFISGDQVKEGAVVIDVGINRLDDGSLVGDVDFESVSHRASKITPVPGGVGPMTITMLLSNTLDAVEMIHAQS